jgi:bacteriocin-like protein
MVYNLLINWSKQNDNTGEHIMAKIEIKDLSVEIKMDKKELKKVIGGYCIPRIPKDPEIPWPWQFPKPSQYPGL